MTEVALGIDIGSYGARAFMVEITAERGSNPHTYQISSKRGNHRDDYTFYDADFPSVIKVRDLHDATPVEIPAKYAFYALCPESDSLLKQHPQADQLSAQHNSAMGRRQIERGISGLLASIKEQVDAICTIKKLTVSRIGLTIPAQWTLEFEDAYRRILAPVFTQVEASDIQFYTEAEALGQYLLREHWDELDPNNKYNGVMFMDFGGHCMNGFQCVLARDTDNLDRSCFIRVGEAKFGAAGGSEAWMWHLKQWFYRNYHQLSDGENATEEQWKDFAEAAKVKRADPMEPHQSITRTYVTRGSGKVTHVTISLDQKEIQAAYEGGLARVVEVSNQKVMRLAQLIQEGDVQGPFFILASGGSARNPQTKARIQQICKHSGFDVKFIFDLVARFESDAVARGAAFAASQRMTVSDWFERGGTIALQMRQISSGGPKADTRWDHTALRLIDISSFTNPGPGQVKRIKVMGANSHKLICDPFHRKRDNDNLDCVRAAASYDFLLLNRLSKGEWCLRCSVKGRDDDVMLRIEQWHTPITRSRGRDRYGKQKQLETLEIPLYVDWSSFTLQAGERNKDINELDIAGIPPQPREVPEETDEPARKLLSHQRRVSTTTIKCAATKIKVDTNEEAAISRR
ncbi:hypothetical protein QBC34DRAFT_494006 [Podospora aff. communis PSN243]|uniref:Uncharacterized protein n=1 Tax=Podospora aff. communis PSN243 TaxID=3040156 RepID=A0AAV9GQZ1_9PEZI|nr:hypothetical protein QBC34DRAFT_494006 [Podospora aff. communis PSN243]